MRRPGPVPEDYWGCRRTCWNADRHLKDDGCAYAPPPPCQHPAESIGYDSEGEGRAVECQDCQTPMSVRKLAEEARVAISMGCTCTGDFCAETCQERPTGWTLDPAKVLRILELEEHL